MKTDAVSTLFTRQKKFILVAPRVVWDVQCDVANWQQWHPDIRFLSAKKTITTGSPLDFKYKHLHFTGEIIVVETNRRLEWVLQGMGIEITHNWLFEECNRGTLVTLEETLKGWPAQLLKKYTKSTMEYFVEEWLQFLKKSAEK